MLSPSDMNDVSLRDLHTNLPPDMSIMVIGALL